MDNQAPVDIQPIAQPAPFSTWTECEKAFKAIAPPISETVREDFLSRIRASQRRRYFSFRYLVERALGDRGTKLAPFEAPLLAMLSEGQPFVKLEERGSREAVERWVTDRLEEVTSKDDWKRFLNSYEHLWVLYLILRTWHTEAVFTAALTAFSKCIRRLMVKGKKKSTADDRPESLENFTRTLSRKVPEKPVFSKPITDLLGSAQSLIALSAHLADEVMEKNRRLETLGTDHAELRIDADGLRAENKRLQAKLNESKASVGDLRGKLDQEQQHFERQKGVNEELRKKMIADLLAEIRRSCLLRLQSIKGFTDRDEPNKSGIIRLANEIEEILQQVKVN
jgi:hypothetical protein